MVTQRKVRAEKSGEEENTGLASKPYVLFIKIRINYTLYRRQRVRGEEKKRGEREGEWAVGAS